MNSYDLTGSVLTPRQIYEQLVLKGLNKADAAIVVGTWIIENAGGTPRVFQYNTPFAATEPTCTSQFVRSFLHQDWLDGADVVQAETTTGEEGFNLRFHRIEDDLDALGQDVARAFVCLAGMRGALRTLLDEIRTELNLINAALVKTGVGTKEGGGTLTGPVKYVGTTKYFGKVSHVFETPQGTVITPLVEGVKAGPLVNPRVQRTVLLARFATEPKVKAFFAATTRAVTPTQMVKAFGDEDIGEGYRVRDVMAILSSRSRFDTPEELVERVAEREAAALRTTGEDDELLNEVFGLTGTARLREAPVERLDMIPTEGRTALNAAGYTTIGSFAGGSVAELTRELGQHGVDVTEADVAGWQAAAKTFTMVR